MWILEHDTPPICCSVTSRHYVQECAALTASTLLVSHFPPDVEPAAGIYSHLDTRASVRSSTDVGDQVCSQSAFQFIPKVLDAVEVRALYRLVKFFPHKLGKLLACPRSILHTVLLVLDIVWSHQKSNIQYTQYRQVIILNVFMHCIVGQPCN